MYGIWCDSECSFDQHWKQPCLARVSTCFWTNGTEFLQHVRQSAYTVSAGMCTVPVTLFFTSTRGTYIGKNGIYVYADLMAFTEFTKNSDAKTSCLTFHCFSR